MSVKISDRDAGMKRLLDAARKAARGAGVSVGIHAKEGQKPHKAEKEGGPAEPMTVLDVAIINEFGLGVPERSFLRKWVDQNPEKNAAALRKVAAMALRGERTLEQGLELLGISMAGGIQLAIGQNTLDLLPNADSTVQKKGSSKPLIDSGQMRQSITSQVRGAKPPTG